MNRMKEVEDEWAKESAEQDRPENDDPYEDVLDPAYEYDDFSP